MTARFRPEGPYGFTGDELPRRRGETHGAYVERAYAYCEIVVLRAEMDFVRAHRACPDGACRRMRRCLGPDYSCRPVHAGRLLGWLEQGYAVDCAYAELEQARRSRAECGR